MKTRHLWVALSCLLICTALVLADTLKLRDGTVLEGKVIPQGDKYWIKLTTGESRLIDKTDVLTFTPGDTKAAATPASPTLSATNSPAGDGASFAAIKSKIDHTVDVPLVGVTMWEKFIDSKPAPSLADITAAKAELKIWTQRQKDNAERIKGKWVGGEDKKKLMKQVDDLIKEASEQIKEGQSVAATKKLEDALTLYPQSFAANFELGLYYLQRGVMGSDGRGNNAYMDKSIKSLETATKILPTSAATWSNLAIGYNFKHRYVDSVKVAYRAAKIHESKETVQNLVNALSYAPAGMREQGQMKPIMEEAIQMAGAHAIPVKAGEWVYVRPNEGNTKGDSDDPEAQAPPGAAWSGSGFFVTSDGYLITNHHVATGDPKKPLQKDVSFRVRMDNGDEKNAEIIAIDDAADISIMKIKVDAPVEFLKIADALPEQGADALVLGYPATGEEKPSMQISHGSVKSLHAGEEYEVWYDLNTTHGNSGGPIVDANCRVIGILTAGWQSYNMTIVGGVGPIQIKNFLTKLGARAPKVQYAAMSEAEQSFSSEKLTKQARKSTVFVLAIKGVDSGGDAGDAKTGGDAPADK